MKFLVFNSPALRRVRSAASLLNSVRWRNKVLAVADQAVISIANFVTMFLLARRLTPFAFGEFALVYAAMLFANIIPNTLIIQPFSVLAPSHSRSASASYFSGTAAGQVVLILIEICLANFVAAIGHGLHWQCAPLLLAVGPAVAAWQLQEFARRALYVQNRIAAALGNDLISYGSQAVVIAGMFASGSLSGAAALYVVAITSFAAAIVGAWQLRRSFARPDLESNARNYRLGKWLTGAALMQWCSSLDMYSFLAAWLIGASVAGKFRIAILIFGPARVLSLPIGTLLPIRFANARNTAGEHAMEREVRKAFGIVIVVLGGYCLVAAVAARPLLAIFGAGYDSDPGILVLYAITSFIAYLQSVWSAALTARHETRTQFDSTLFGAVFSLMIGSALIRTFGAYGALVGLLLTSGGVALMFFRSYRRTSNTAAQQRDASDSSPDSV